MIWCNGVLVVVNCLFWNEKKTEVEIENRLDSNWLRKNIKSKTKEKKKKNRKKLRRRRRRWSNEDNCCHVVKRQIPISAFWLRWEGPSALIKSFPCRDKEGRKNAWLSTFTFSYFFLLFFGCFSLSRSVFQCFNSSSSSSSSSSSYFSSSSSSSSSYFSSSSSSSSSSSLVFFILVFYASRRKKTLMGLYTKRRHSREFSSIEFSSVESCRCDVLCQLLIALFHHLLNGATFKLSSHQ